MKDLSLKLFISYSRSDSSFVAELVSGLRYDGSFDIFLDTKAIKEGESWRKRIESLIAGVDTVVFVISPESINSGECMRELEIAQSYNKRLMPVVRTPLDNIAVPSALSSLNYVRFDQAPSFIEGLTTLRDALNTDITWLREHTRLLTRAREWHEAGRPNSRLLSGQDIDNAIRWSGNGSPNDPDVTDLHFEYIHTSEQQHIELESRRKARQRNFTIAMAAIGLVAMFASVAALQWRRAVNANEDLTATNNELRIAEENLSNVNNSLDIAVEDFTTVVCTGAIESTYHLSTTSNSEQWSKYFNIFAYLYSGPMNSVESHQRLAQQSNLIADSMVVFAELLYPGAVISRDTLPSTVYELYTQNDALKTAAKKVLTECDKRVKEDLEDRIFNQPTGY